jgi:aspartate racemase
MRVLDSCYLCWQCWQILCLEYLVVKVLQSQVMSLQKSSELVNGIILDKTKSGLLEIVNSLKEKTGIQGLILGGTELPLILGQTEDRDIPFLDTTRIHVESVVDRLL